MSAYIATNDRYSLMPYRRCGHSGLLLPVISFGLWHNFSAHDSYENCRNLICTAFDEGITHFDLANNYGPPPGFAEQTMGSVLKEDLKPYRDEIIISTKAGYEMWEGPYGNWGSRKYLFASMDASLKRLGLSYVDIFYSHRYDPHTPLEETMTALHHLVTSGKALYVGISNYPDKQASMAINLLNQLGTKCLIHQTKYSMLERTAERGLFNTLDSNGVGCIAFSPLAQGLLTDKYLNGIPDNSRAAKKHTALKPELVTESLIDKLKALNGIAAKREQSLAQMAVSWLLKDSRITSVLIGASRIDQIHECAKAAHQSGFSMQEVTEIETILGNSQ